MLRYLVLLCWITGCDATTINNFACADGADDGGCVMRYAGDGGRRPHGFDGDANENAEQGGLFRDGAQLQGTANLILGQSAVLIDAVSKDGLAHVYTIALGLIGNIPPSSALAADAEVVGRFTVGIGDNFFTVDVDFQNGVEFSIAARSIRLEAIYQITPASTLTASPGTYTVAANLAIGELAQGSPPQRTIVLGGVAVGANQLVAIPTFAKSFQVLSFDGISWDGPVLWQIHIFGSSAIIQRLVTVVNQSEVFVLPNGSRQMYFFNAGPTMAILRVLYELSL